MGYEVKNTELFQYCQALGGMSGYGSTHHDMELKRYFDEGYRPACEPVYVAPEGGPPFILWTFIK